MDKIKILVTCHKPCNVYSDDVYIPIHVGRANSKYKDEMAEMIGDNTGDNISEKNPMYSELTAHYWAWKNLHDVEYIGFCHYRRYFKYRFTKDNVDVLKDKDMMVLSYRFLTPIYHQIIKNIGWEDFTILLMVLKKKYPEYEQTMIKYLCGNTFNPKNMFVCKKTLFDKYAEWLFDILFECEKHIKPSPYTRARRGMGYMGEFLLSVYIIHNHLSVKRTIYSDSRKKTFPATIKVYIRKFLCLLHIKNANPKTLDAFYGSAILDGLELDCIKI